MGDEIDDFERSSLGNYTGDTAEFETTTSPHDRSTIPSGSYVLQAMIDNSSTGNEIQDNGEIVTFPSQGDKFEVYMSFDDGSTGEKQGIGFRWDYQDTDNYWELTFGTPEPDSSALDLRLEYWDGGTSTVDSVDASNYGYEWFLITVDWGNSTSGETSVSAEGIDSGDTASVSVSTDATHSTSHAAWEGYAEKTYSGSESFADGAYITDTGGSAPNAPSNLSATLSD